MASRLSRWGVITGVALLLMMVLLLPPAPSARDAGWGVSPDEPTNGLDGMILANRTALGQAQTALTRLRRQRVLDRYRTGGPALLVLAARPDTFVVDSLRTRAAAALWRTLPTGSAPPRTLLIVSGESERIAPATVTTCEARLPGSSRSGSALYDGAGSCWLQARFGPPGAGLRAWLDSMGGVEVPRPRARDRAEIREVGQSHDVWPRLVFGDGEVFAWWGTSELEACAAGRVAYCAASLRFAPSAERSAYSYFGWSRDRLLAGIPAKLLFELGPDRFATLWRSDRPVPESYERLTGRPFGEWAEGYVQRRLGRVVRNTALSLPGWLGWMLWMVLLGGWMGARLRTQGVTS